MQNNFNVNPEEAKGFVKNLLSLDKFVTPKLIHVFYIIGLICLAIFFVVTLLSALMAILQGNLMGGLGVLLLSIGGTIIYTLLLRVSVEMTILAFKNNEYLKKISEK
ncbi:DUF4282 domain-containing protein [Bartonella sp. HY038]|uniref:DUF4282 domain-containing protein n=1 Tax=Bartonella sp. HY038 TaxID=2759660 RepID=UPI0015FD91EC|nr:DUF4282 domain-containing protein [Bartonella sp. HY038]